MAAQKQSRLEFHSKLLFFYLVNQTQTPTPKLTVFSLIRLYICIGLKKCSTKLDSIMKQRKQPNEIIHHLQNIIFIQYDIGCFTGFPRPKFDFV
jgi:hypothetical protein